MGAGAAGRAADAGATAQRQGRPTEVGGIGGVGDSPLHPRGDERDPGQGTQPRHGRKGCCPHCGANNYAESCTDQCSISVATITRLPWRTCTRCVYLIA